MTSSLDHESGTAEGPNERKQILLNAFDMSTVGHLSPGQWKVRQPSDLLNPTSPSIYALETDRSALRIQKTNRPPKGTCSIGLISPSFSSKATSTLYSWPTPTVATIRMKRAWITASVEQRSGQ